MRTILSKYAVMLCLAVGNVGAQATLLSGSFSGHARDSTWSDVPSGTFVSGIFALDTSGAFQSGGQYLFSDDAFSLSFDAPSFGFHHDLLLFFGDLAMGRNAEAQSVRITTTFPHGETAILRLVGAPGSFFDEPVIESLHGGAPDPNLSSLYLSTHALIGFDVDLVTIAFTGSTDIPEPGSLALLGIGMVGLGISRRVLRSKAERRALALPRD